MMTIIIFLIIELLDTFPRLSGDDAMAEKSHFLLIVIILIIDYVLYLR